MQESKLNLIREQLQEAQKSDKDAMSSTLIVEGEMMSFEIEELKIRLRERETEVGALLAVGKSCYIFIESTRGLPMWVLLRACLMPFAVDRLITSTTGAHRRLYSST